MFRVYDAECAVCACTRVNQTLKIRYHNDTICVGRLLYNLYSIFAGFIRFIDSDFCVNNASRRLEKFLTLQTVVGYQQNSTSIVYK